MIQCYLVFISRFLEAHCKKVFLRKKEKGLVSTSQNPEERGELGSEDMTLKEILWYLQRRNLNEIFRDRSDFILAERLAVQYQFSNP